MVNRWSITNVSRAPGSQGLRDCAREYLIFRCASCYSIFSRVLGNQFARPKFGHTYAQSRLRHGRMHGRRDARRTRVAVFPRAYARVRAPATRPAHPRPSTGPTMRLRACGRISGASARGAARTRAADARRRDDARGPGGNAVTRSTPRRGSRVETRDGTKRHGRSGYCKVQSTEIARIHTPARLPVPRGELLFCGQELGTLRVAGRFGTALDRRFASFSGAPGIHKSGGADVRDNPHK